MFCCPRILSRGSSACHDGDAEGRPRQTRDAPVMALDALLSERPELYDLSLTLSQLVNTLDELNVT